MTKLHRPLPPSQSPKLPVQLLVLSSDTRVIAVPPGERCSRFRLCKTRLIILVLHRFGDTWCTEAHVPGGVFPQHTQHIPLGASVCCICAKTWEEKQSGSLFNLAEGIVLAVLDSLMRVVFSQPFCLCGLFVSHRFLSTGLSPGLPTPAVAVSHHCHLLVLVGFEVTTRSSKVHCHFKAVAKHIADWQL